MGSDKLDLRNSVVWRLDPRSVSFPFRRLLSSASAQRAFAILAILFSIARTEAQVPDRSSRFNGPQVRTTGNSGAGVIKYPTPAISVIEKNRSQSIAWAEIARRTIVPTMHLVETDHFLIFSAWNRSNDRALRNVCEEMYAKLCRQLNVTPSEAVWIGKCPIYVFWKTRDYLRFTAEVDKTLARRADLFHAAGYHSTRGLFSYIVLNGAEDFGQTRDGAIQRFYEVLVHEGTHAFMNRYVTGRTIPVWVEEGFADFMAATLVPLSDANLKYAKSARRALERGVSLSKILDKKSLNYSEYGVAQSLIRFMIRSNPQAFHQFIILLKNGKTEADALRESYRASREDLLRSWVFANR